MPKSKVQNVLFTIVMAFVMVYALVCYNIALDKGGMSNEIFLIAFHEIVIMLPVAFVLEFFIVEKSATKLAFRIVTRVTILNASFVADFSTIKNSRTNATGSIITIS